MNEPVPAPSQNPGEESGSGPLGASYGRPRRPNLLDAVGALAGFIVLSIVAGAGAVALLGGSAGSGPSLQATSALIATPVAWLALGGWAIWVSVRRGAGLRADYAWSFRPKDALIGVGAAVLALVAGGIYALVYVQLTGEQPNSAVGIVAEGSGVVWQVLGLTAMALAAPFVEELHFRGLWWTTLRRRGLAQGWVLVLTSAVFALFHFELERAPLLFVIGLLAGGARMLTGRIGAAIATHLTVNLVGSLGLLATLATMVG